MSTFTTKDGTGAPHGMCTTLKDQVNADLLAFIKGGRSIQHLPPAVRRPVAFQTVCGRWASSGR